jgi:hypothetical protein
MIDIEDPVRQFSISLKEGVNIMALLVWPYRAPIPEGRRVFYLFI